MSIEITNEKISNSDVVSIKQMGNIIELCYTQKRNNKATIKKLNENECLVLSTGEIIECNHIENRSQSLFQVGQSLKRLRDYINNNVLEPNNCKWITLTYAENMKDTKRLYEDFKKFVMRFRYKYGKFEYIVAMEPQGRGAWHCHMIAIFDSCPGYIPNKEISDLWSNGFTSVHKLDNIDNIGAYLTAYLGDMEFTNDNLKIISDITKSSNKFRIKEVDEIEGKKLKQKKKFIKGGRLYLYPPKFNLYRVSRGIKKPDKKYSTYGYAKKMLGISDKTPNYSKSLKINDVEKNFSNNIIYEQYNLKR